jgi:hypothetical protein
MSKILERLNGETREGTDKKTLTRRIALDMTIKGHTRASIYFLDGMWLVSQPPNIYEEK